MRSFRCATYQFTCPNEILFWRPERLQGLVETMADEFFESGYGEHPILFHVFSNGGCYVLLRFLQYFQKRRQQASSPSGVGDVDLRGLVFDSSPARSDGWTRAQAFTEAMYGNYRPWIKKLLAGALGVVFSIWNWYRATISWIRGLPSPTSTHPYVALSKLDLRCPMLFLYSKADSICKYHYIESFMEKQRRRGVQVSRGDLAMPIWSRLRPFQVTQVRFDNSPHCQHQRFYSNEYNEAVKNFLYETMGTSPSSSRESRSKSGDVDNGEDFVQVGDNGNDKTEDTDDFELAD